jgi:hypothetical protein
MEKLAARLADSRLSKQGGDAVSYFWPGLVLRNIVFALIVIFHGFRRMLPPY